MAQIKRKGARGPPWWKEGFRTIMVRKKKEGNCGKKYTDRLFWRRRKKTTRSEAIENKPQLNSRGQAQKKDETPDAWFC